MEHKVLHPGTPPTWLGLVAVASAVLLLAETPGRGIHERTVPGRVIVGADRQPAAGWLVSLAEAVRRPSSVHTCSHVWHEITSVLNPSRSAAPRDSVIDAIDLQPVCDLPLGLLNLPPPSVHI